MNRGGLATTTSVLTTAKTTTPATHPVNVELDRHNPECIEFADNVNFLIYLKEPSKLINNCPCETLNCLQKINSFNSKHSSASFDLLTYDAQKRFVQILNDYFQYIYEYLRENAAYTRALEPRRFEILCQFALILWTWTDRSRDFCIRLHDYHFIRVLFKVIKLLVNNLKICLTKLFNSFNSKSI